jgi:hypothetical protein
MEKTLTDKRILEKLTRARKSLAIYTTTKKLKLKHLIMYSNLRTYINLKKHDWHARNLPSYMKPCIHA